MTPPQASEAAVGVANGVAVDWRAVDELIAAAQNYFDRYCVDEADDTFDPDEQYGEETGCTRQQHKDAKRLRRALAALQAPTP